MTPKCIWTNQRSDRLKEIEIETAGRFGAGRKKETVYVLEEHEQKVRNFASHVDRNALRFTLFMLALPFVGVVAALLTAINEFIGLVVVGGMLVLLGIVLIVYPFATPLTVKVLGLRRSILIARFSGVVIILMGIVLPIVIPMLEA